MTGDEEDYVLWNYMLDEHFLAADTHDGVVQLTITPHTLAKAVRETTGEVLEPEEAEQSLAKAVSSVYASRVRSSSWKLFALASADRTDVPFATGFLALSVLAAFHMHTDDERSARAFYPRLAEMLGCRLVGTYPEGFTGDGFAKLWHELDHWLHSRRGRRLAKPQADAARRYVAYPFAHVPLREVDIERTPQFFDAFGYEPGSPSADRAPCLRPRRRGRTVAGLHRDRATRAAATRTAERSQYGRSRRSWNAGTDAESIRAEDERRASRSG